MVTRCIIIFALSTLFWSLQNDCSFAEQKSSAVANTQTLSFRWTPLERRSGKKFYREFRDSTGQHSTEAHFVEKKNNRYRLEKKTGKIVSVPFTKLSRNDQKWLLNERRIRSHKLVSHELHIKIDINLDRREKIASSYGFPEKWIDAEDQLTTWEAASLLQKLQQRGVIMHFQCGTEISNKLSSNDINPTGANRQTFGLGPDWQWAINESKEDLAPLAEEILKAARTNGYQTKRDIAAVVASFVQSIRYKQPPQFYRHPELGKVSTMDLSLPLDTLCQGYGDCDSLSVLFAGIMANMPNQEVIFMVGKRGHQHLFVGVQIEPEDGEAAITYDGDKYVLIELTDEYELGDIPAAELKAHRQNKLVPMKVVN